MLQDIVPRNVFAEMDDMLRRLDGFFEGRGLDGAHGLTQVSARLYPQFHVREEEGNVVLVADVPGLSPDNLQVTYEGDVLTVRGHFDDAVEEGWRRVTSERSRWRFERSFRFSRPIQADRIEARLSDGVLRITAPKRAPSTHNVTVTEG